MRLINNIKQNIIINNSVLYKDFIFDKTVDSKIYFSELLLITNDSNYNRINEWLNWHLNIIKFDHIILIDNTENKQLKNTCLLYEKVTYIHKPGILNQSAIYTEYVNNSKAQWVLPIDDDEYLYISDKYNNNINTYLSYLTYTKPMYKYTFNWHMMFSIEPVYAETNSFINFFKYTILDKINLDLGEAFAMCKTIVNTDIKHLYINEINKPIKLTSKEVNGENIDDCKENSVILGSVHNPISKLNNKFVHSYNPEVNQTIIGLIIGSNKIININSDCFIAHYKYTSIERWYNKISKFRFVDIFSKKFLETNYRKETYTDIYKFIQNRLIIQDQLYKLLEK